MNISRFLIISFFLLINSTGFSQTYFPVIKQENIKSFINLEKSLKSALLPNREKYMNSSDFNLAQPIQFSRKNTDFHPAPIIKYFFSLPDSIVRQIDIEIDSLNYLPQTYKDMIGYSEPMNRLKAFEKEYNVIYDELFLTFGKSSESKTLRKEEYGRDSYAWKRNDKWENDSLNIDMYLVFADEKKTGGEYKIRVYINFKDKREHSKFNHKQDSVAKAFIQFILGEKYQQSWNILNSKMRQMTKYDEFSKFADYIKSIGNKSAIELTTNEAFLFGAGRIYSYKFIPDSSEIKEEIKIIFADNESLQILFFRLSSF